MARFDKFIALAQRLIAKNGQDTILRLYTDAPEADADKPWRTGAPASSDTTVKAVFLNFGDLGRAGERYMDATDIQIGDKLVLIAGGVLASPPALRDRLYREGGGPGDPGFGILKVETLDPNGQAVLHKLHVRQ